ncbi:npc intracellular cholesterol transporter 1 [Anaeramoeba flamelloides]|uniref:Npc intracellular cholesterol transporter n=1 Tax=Anaeramoeba flamelloides TaxID=1746091 RepID=A0AAV7ZJW7_9EUKA|nr:npc intracellular cholesterol transporter [Anaeramoeba flamelloides]KAJ6226833.1 npc intracellular cholesterol transporter 1 [Anaeramoeba flamelloides]|eukprot:Anaeramoba_flamelloidesa332582_109.p1 GENE.a332582_109~~a332582_109.p1  ORF type:complete len:273 (-),score=29.09 a332582_109:64-837(-)
MKFVLIVTLIVLFKISLCYEGCAMQGNPLVIHRQPPQPFPDMIICKKFESAACCNMSQDILFKNEWKQAISFMGSCPACLDNLQNTWCNYACGPNQRRYVSTVSHTDGDPIQKPVFKMCRRWAKSVYESCQWVHFVRSMWPTYEEFWQTQAERAIPKPVTIEYPDDDDDPSAFCPLDELIHCEDTCSCLSCPPGCENASNLKYEKKDIKKIWNVLAFNFWVGCLIGILSLLLIIIIIVGIVHRVKNSKKNTQYEAIN